VISAIIPVGNFNRDCENVEYIVNLANGHPIQIIIVNDSIDFTEDIKARILSKGNSNLLIVESKARNPGGARNIGFQYATCETIIFWDSDDQPNVHEVISMNKLLVTSQSDFIIGGYTRKNNKIPDKYFPPQNKSLRLITNPGLWRIMFKKSFIKDLKLANCKIGEDQIFLASVFGLNPNISIFNESVYNYSQSASGITSSPTIIKNYEIALSNLEQNGPPKMGYKKAVYFNLLLSYLKRTNLINPIKSISALKSVINKYGFISFYDIIKTLIIKVFNK
jgi:glycosyltransferase involved in cell wall biosynthesis